MTRPRISVLLPVRNGKPFLEAAIASVLAQSLADFELLVIDNGSTDGSGGAALAFGDPRIRLVTAEGRGLARALNIGLAEAAGEFVARQDADDVSHPERLARQAAFLDANPSVDVLATRAAFVDDRGAPADTAWTRAVGRQWDAALAPDAIARLMPLTCCLVHGTVMARRAALRAVRGYREDLPVAQDYDLWLRLLPRHQFAKLPEPLYTFRLHGAQMSAAAHAEQRRQAIAAKLRYLRGVIHRAGLLRAWIVDDTPGAAHYRAMLAEAGMVEVAEDAPWDVAIVTDFARLDERLSDVEGRVRPAATIRTGNFLLRHRMAA